MTIERAIYLRDDVLVVYREQTLDATTPRYLDEAISWKVLEDSATNETVSRPSSSRWSATPRDGRFSRDLGSARGTASASQVFSPFQVTPEILRSLIKILCSKEIRA